jgi:DNA-binding NarL/FixJ family response regulator
VLLDEARTYLAHGRVPDAADALQRAIDALDSHSRQAEQAIDDLTPAETRVARMAAAGRKNREIATELRVTVKAVEFHLANTYRKLGIRSRTELTRMFNWVAPVLALLETWG